MGLGLLFPILLLAMGIYVLVGAIKGSGRLFSMDNFKDESKPKAKKLMRILYFALAAVMLLMFVVNGLETVLFTNKLTYYRITDAYKDAFSDILEDDGTLTYTATESASSGGMSCLGVSTAGQEVTYGPYSVDNQMMDITEISAFINKAYSVYKDDRTKFPLTSGGLMSCGGSTVDYSMYYQQTDLIDDAGNPVYEDSEKANGHVVYVSSFGNVRSDANDGSFFSKLYQSLRLNLLTVFNYVLLGLAAAGLMTLFFITRKYTDKEKLKKAREQQVSGPSMPSSAFVFDEEESKSESPKK